MSRCVRRSFLCGFDRYSGRSYEHRRQWIEDRFHQLASIFAIDLCGYAVMSNHYHVILRIDPDRASSWTIQQVNDRWTRLYDGSLLVNRLLSGESLTKELTDAAMQTVEKWRERLGCLSWFMRCVNECVARQANAEDRCKGRFWEGRFKSQALLDERALLQCMAYVDLNPIRAAMSSAPETSDHTSIQARIQAREGQLLPFLDQTHSAGEPLPMRYRDYLELVDWTGRAIRQDKRGSITAPIPSILDRLDIQPRIWVRTTRNYGKWYYRAVGQAESMFKACERLGQKWLLGTPLDRIKPS